MQGFKAAILLPGLLLTACATSLQTLDHSELSSARDAIAAARAAKAEQCAPELLARAQAMLIWAAHELEEGARANPDIHPYEELRDQSEAVAREAEQISSEACREVTTVILLPDEDGKVGTVLLKTDSVSQAIEQAYHYSSVSGRSDAPEPVKEMGEATVKKLFSRLLEAQPPKPARFTLYFVSGTSELTEESIALIPEVIKAAQERQPSEVSIAGHSDATGSKSLNMRISSQRAEAVKRLLEASDAPPKSIYLRFHGENDPLIPTPDNVAEPRNRRVEITIL